MFRRPLVVLALALLAASCSSSDVLATVNGEEITKDDLYALRPAYEADLTDVTGEDLREDVSALIVLNATLQVAEEDYGLVVDEATIAVRLADPPERYLAVLGTGPQDSAEAESARRSRAIVTLLLDTVGPELVREQEGGYDTLLSSRPGIVTRSCVRHIAVATLADAEDVLARLEAGEDFVELAAEVSLDRTSPEGLLIGPEGTCLTWLSALGDEFATLAATAELNVPSGPVATGIGYSVIRVEDRVAPASVAELADDPMEYLELSVASTLYSGWASDSVRDADVEVSPVLGRWSSAGFGISPPSE